MISFVFDEYFIDVEIFELFVNLFLFEEIGSKVYDLYEKFRLDIFDGLRGWGVCGFLNFKYVKEFVVSG